jgi:hypothetical protein
LKYFIDYNTPITEKEYQFVILAYEPETTTKPGKYIISYKKPIFVSELNTTQIGTANYFITITDINVKAGDSNGTMRGTFNAEHHFNKKDTLIRFDADITFVLEKKNGVFTDDEIKTEGILFRYVSKSLLSNLGITAVFQMNTRLWDLFNIVFDGNGTYTITEKKPTATENTQK